MRTPRDEIDRYLQRMPNAREAMTRDPQNHWQIEWARRNLELLDLAKDIRLRVISTLLHGTADESEATRLIREATSRPPAKPTVPKGSKP